MIYTSKKIIIFLFTIIQLAILSSCMDSGYRLSFPEIDDLADEYTAQAKVFLSRADSNDNKGYYKLLTAKIEYQLNGYIYKENYIDDAINIFVNEKDADIDVGLPSTVVKMGENVWEDVPDGMDWPALPADFDTITLTIDEISNYTA